MSSYNPGALSQQSSNLRPGQRNALVVQPPPGTFSNTQVAASTASSQNQFAGTVVISQQHAQSNVQGVQVQTASLHAQLTARNANLSSSAAVEIGETTSDPSVLSTAPALPAPTASTQPSQGGNAATKAITSGERGIVPQALQNGSGQTMEVARLERGGEASKQAGEVKVDSVHVKAGNVAVGAVRAEAVVEGERQVVHQAIELTDDGNVTLRQYIHTERVFYRRVFEVMYVAATNEPEDPEEETKKEKCIDCCFQSFHCNFKKLLRLKASPEDKEPRLSAVSRINYMTPILRRGRSKGWVLHTKMIFPLVKASVRNFWVAAEFSAVLLALILSITSFTLGKNRTFNILHLALTIAGSILASVDGLILLCSCRLCRDCTHKAEQTSESQQQDCEAEVSTHEAEQTLKPQQQLPEAGSGETSESKGICKECLNATRNRFDLIRMILSELIFYPLLICDIFELIVSETYFFDNVEDGISFALFVISLASELFFVYIMRIAILIAANYHSQKKRLPKDGRDFDRSNSKSASYFQSYFVIHVCAQMLAQVLMIIAIAGVIREENRHLFGEDKKNDTKFNNESNTMDKDESIHVSNYLWYMLVSGYVLPIFGILTFFIVTYFWAQEFPIGICTDVLSVLQAPGIDEVVDFGKTKEESGDKMSKINRYIHLSELKKQFKNLRDTKWYDKFAYAFQSPQMVIISMMYTALQITFVACALKAVDDNTAWVIYFVIAGIIGYVANLYVFTVALLWAIIIGSILLMIAFLIAFLIFCCIICTCLSSDSSNNNRYRR